MNRTRIVVADPLRIFRTGVANLLARESDFEVVEVGSLVELAEAIGPGDRCPDLALIDVDLPPLGGVGAVRELARRCNTHMILWSLRPSRDEVLDGIRAGAHGFLHKEISGAGLMRALRGAVQGEAPLARDLATLMIDALHGVEERTEALERASVLSSRERQVLDLIAGGARNREIAVELEISEFTVKRHVQNILEKLELPSRRSAAELHRTAFIGETATAPT